MRRTGYQALGFVVWNGARIYVRRRYGDAPRKIFAASLVVLVVGLLVTAQRRAASDS